MKTKFCLLLSLILIVIVAITSYTPQAAQAEVQTQKDPVTETEEIPFPDAGEGPSRPDAENQINGRQWFYFNAVGINFVPHDSALTYFNNGCGCLASNYTGTVAKTFTLPVNVPDKAKGSIIFFTYYNNVANPTNGAIEVSLWRRHYFTLQTEEIELFRLDQTGSGGQYKQDSLLDMVFDTSTWLYWLEFKLPQGTNEREFCGISIMFEYENPPIFPVALPMIQR